MCYSPRSRRTREHELNENARRDDGVGGVRELRVCMQELESKALIDKKMVEGELTGD
jgi:hypothetical protein